MNLQNFPWGALWREHDKSEACVLCPAGDRQPARKGRDGAAPPAQVDGGEQV